jgi:hypothetical protein
MKRIKIILFLCMFVPTASLHAQDLSVFWEIGRHDQSAKEFALSNIPFDYEQYCKQYNKQPAVFTIGQSHTEMDFGRSFCRQRLPPAQRAGIGRNSDDAAHHGQYGTTPVVFRSKPPRRTD